MVINGGPDIRGPVAVEFVRVLNVEHVVGIDFVRVVLDRADGKGIRLAILFEYGHDLALIGRAGRAVGHDVLDFQFFDGQQQAGLVGEIGVMALQIVPIVSAAVADFDPYRLLGQLFCGLQIIGIEFLRDYVVVGVERRRLLSGLFDSFGVALVESVARAQGRQEDGHEQRNLYVFLQLRTPPVRFIPYQNRTKPEGPNSWKSKAQPG